MADVLVRDLDDPVYERLKARAARNYRSLEGEILQILTAVSWQVDMTTARARAETMQRQTAGHPHSDSGAILAEERMR